MRCARSRPAAARGRAAPGPAPREGAGAGPAAGRSVLPRSPDHRVNVDLLPLSQISDALAARSVAPEALLESCLARVKALDEKIHAFLRLTESEARSAARAAGQRRTAGKPIGPLDGVPVALKDLFCMEGVEPA